jgi:hypothetical protein
MTVLGDEETHPAPGMDVLAQGADHCLQPQPMAGDKTLPHASSWGGVHRADIIKLIESA